MTDIHQTAIVDENAKIGKNVSIGPYSAIGPEVKLGDGIELISHVVISGRTTIGANTRVFPFASIGHQPQDQKYNGEASSLEIGCNNVIREYVTMNPGTEGGGMVTRIGNNCLFMVGAHVAHEHGAERSGQCAGQVDYLDLVQRRSHINSPRLSV